MGHAGIIGGSRRQKLA